jgi:hypothetical protein
MKPVGPYDYAAAGGAGRGGPTGSLLGSHRRNCLRFYSALIALRSGEWARLSVGQLVAVDGGGSGRIATRPAPGWPALPAVLDAGEPNCP